VGLIQLQLRQVHDKEAQTALMDTSRRIMSIAAVHERLYQTDEVGTVNVASYLAQVIAGIRATASHEVKFELDITPARFSLDSAIPLALLVNELVTNALKYAYAPPLNGLVSITLKPENESMILTVADNGNGFPSGFEPRKSRSLGMKIIASLCRQLDAELAFLDNQPGVICIARFSAALHMSR
jgi:two-component sensor histidine kinase